MRPIGKEGLVTFNELLIIIAIVVILAIIVVPKFLDLAKDAKKNACQQNQETIEKAAFLWKNESIGYPESIQIMVKFGYLDKMPKCPSKGKYIYNSENGTVKCSLAKHVRDEEKEE